MSDKELRDASYIINGMHVHYMYKDGQLWDISIQREDGEIMFSGYPDEARELFEVLDQLAGEETI